LQEKEMENAIETTTSVAMCAKMENKWVWVVAGVSVMLLMGVFYYIHRHMKAVSQRFNATEDVLTKVVEKTNQLQHLIQSGCMIGMPPQHPAAVVFQQSAPSQAAVPPVPQAPPVNLDKELAEELKELESAPAAATETEGRVDDAK
jgi:hypothetical protein